MQKNLVGVYWGRFNPIHKGHMAQIMGCMERVNKLIVAVGSAEHTNEKRNPFSGAERVKMIRAYAKEKGLNPNKIKVVAVKDGKSFNQAVANLFKACGKFDILFMDKDFPLAKIASKKVEIKPLPFKGRVEGLSATKVRDAIAAKRKWERFTGKSVTKLIKKFDGMNRIRATYAKEG